jgi:hypothetical protein
VPEDIVSRSLRLGSQSQASAKLRDPARRSSGMRHGAIPLSRSKHRWLLACWLIGLFQPISRLELHLEPRGVVEPLRATPRGSKLTPTGPTDAPDHRPKADVVGSCASRALRSSIRARGRRGHAPPDALVREPHAPPGRDGRSRVEVALPQASCRGRSGTRCAGAVCRGESRRRSGTASHAGVQVDSSLDSRKA